MPEKKLSFEDVNDAPAWTALLASLPTSNTYTSWAWGTYKQRTGWNVRRVRILEEGSPAAAGCFQLQVKNRGPVSILMIQGGIHLRRLSDVAYHEVLEALLASFVAQAKPCALLVNHQAGAQQDAELGLLRAGFSPVLNTSMYTFVLDRAAGALAGDTLSKNWRHNLKRAKNNAALTTRWVEAPPARAESLARLEQFYAKLRDRKAFSAALQLDKARDLIIANPEFRIVEALLDGEVIATRVGYVCSDHVLDFLAASDEAAKNTYANYLLLWELIDLANTTEKSFFDCGGINPADNLGVYNFKKGLGGRMALNGPIWLHASSPLAMKAARALLSLSA